jgi:hypothetical protein
VVQMNNDDNSKYPVFSIFLKNYIYKGGPATFSNTE